MEQQTSIVEGLRQYMDLCADTRRRLVLNHSAGVSL